MRVMAGRLAPDGGDIHFDGRSVQKTPAKRRDAMMVVQEFTSAGIWKCLLLRHPFVVKLGVDPPILLQPDDATPRAYDVRRLPISV